MLPDSLRSSSSAAPSQSPASSLRSSPGDRAREPILPPAATPAAAAAAYQLGQEIERLRRLQSRRGASFGERSWARTARYKAEQQLRTELRWRDDHPARPVPPAVPEPDRDPWAGLPQPGVPPGPEIDAENAMLAVWNAALPCVRVITHGNEQRGSQVQFMLQARGLRVRSQWNREPAGPEDLVLELDQLPLEPAMLMLAVVERVAAAHWTRKGGRR